jgi:hypothetical protein
MFGINTAGGSIKIKAKIKVKVKVKVKVQILVERLLKAQRRTKDIAVLFL